MLSRASYGSDAGARDRDGREDLKKTERDVDARGGRQSSKGFCSKKTRLADRARFRSYSGDYVARSVPYRIHCTAVVPSFFSNSRNVTSRHDYTPEDRDHSLRNQGCQQASKDAKEIYSTNYNIYNIAHDAHADQGSSANRKRPNY